MLLKNKINQQPVPVIDVNCEIGERHLDGTLQCFQCTPEYILEYNLETNVEKCIPRTAAYDQNCLRIDNESKKCTVCDYVSGFYVKDSVFAACEKI